MSNGSPEVELLIKAYTAYNTQDLEELLGLVDDEVDWPAGQAGPGRLHGRNAVRAYWTEQWLHTRTHDNPVRFTRPPGGQTVGSGGISQVVVLVDQIVRALDGSTLSSGVFRHLHHIRDGCIVRLEIQVAA